jgi:hypothetical protein
MGNPMPNKRLETSLYGPVKHYLEMLGFTVKGEVCGCDLVALRGDEPPMVVIGELKLSFNLDLVLQAVDRAGAFMTFGSPSVPQDAAACAIRGLGNSVVSLGSACLVYRPTARLKYWSSLGPGGPAMTKNVVLA